MRLPTIFFRPYDFLVTLSVSIAMCGRRTAFYAWLETPIGVVYVASSNKGVVLLSLGVDEEHFKEKLLGMGFRPTRGGLVEGVVRQLCEYFKGERASFDVPLDVRGTPFQLAVWRAVETIPYGETRSYKWVAERVGRPRAVRAVGRALAANPVPIIIPCHRVVRSDGGLGGFSLGLEVKEFLLELEAKNKCKFEV